MEKINITIIRNGETITINKGTPEEDDK